ncbi:MAG: hypothetical protein COB85_03825 [Bacteroidetes bacterium]|nr:MAG: hypothetical protein COB85_03825 [Bacteroidota bacterium]
MMRNFTKSIAMNTRILALVFLLPIVACSQDESEKSGVADVINKDVNVAAFKAFVAEGKGLILDVRTADEVNEGYIKGAKNIDFFSDEFETEIKKLSTDQPIYVYCRSGGRSGNAAGNMKDWGFKEVYNLDGGINAWKKEGLELVKP